MTNVNPEPQQQQPEYTPNAAQPQAYPNQPQTPQYAPQYQQQPGYATYPPQANPADTGSFGWAVLGFVIPVVGLILWLVWKDTQPKNAHRAGKGALVSVIVMVAIYILIFVIAIIAGVAASSTSALGLL
ncbi:hypothetical protein BW13_11305 [Bifidobacterium sp. UTCIF-37]|uniref:DUF4870 domain-containing protein n=1 Tax=unclassified Bifidobacterium TaxID=2608897 RepID=UPI001C6115E8|nr:MULTISPECIES: DUF4870 domain-containing protein [unclassified Bifidobacterium]TPF85348.1 hypothetical protein BW13_11305 [Bifidobacterium sp. UTCIF-37]TPF87269.1 hypothetical protein BW11_11305 [Bifidobacterium sp. UTCIF-38]